MAPHPRPGTRVLGLSLVLSVMGALAPAAPAGAAGTGSTLRDESRGRAGHVAARLLDGSPSLVGAGAPASRAPSSTRTATSTRTTTSAQTATAAPDPDHPCDWVHLQVTLLSDHNVVDVQWDGAASIVVERTRSEGAKRLVRTVSADQGVFSDGAINPFADYWYTVTARDSSGSTIGSCDSGYLTYGFEDHSWDVMVAGDGLWQQDFMTDGAQARSGSYVSPAYSADGHLYAATKVDPVDGSGVLEVRRSTSSALGFAVDLGPGVVPADAAFSPDGQTLAFTRYDSGTGEPLGLGFVDVHGTHAVRAVDYAVPVAEPAWRPDGKTLVVTDFAATPGLSLVSPTSTTTTRISGTADGYTPEVGPDGAIYFAVVGDTSSAIRKRLASGAVSTVQSSSAGILVQPRVVDRVTGTLLVELDTPVDPANPSSTWSAVLEQVSPTGAVDTTNVGRGWGTRDGMSGWDVRVPSDAGTSDLAGDRADDLLVRDSGGGLRVRPFVGASLGSAVTLGSGWQGFTAVLPTDLTADGRSDVVARDAYGVLWLYPGVANQRLGTRVRLGSGWNGYLLVTAGDWDGDGVGDLLARDAAGQLWLYPGTGRGTLAPRRLLGSGWGVMKDVVGAGDVDLDNRPDLVARDGSGALWLYPGNGTGGFLARRSLGTGWGSFTALAAVGVVDGRTWIYVRRSTGVLVQYYTKGDGAIDSLGRRDLTSGWNGSLLAG